MVEVAFVEGGPAFVFHHGREVGDDALSLRPVEVAGGVAVGVQHDVRVEEGFAMPFDEVVEGGVPGVELEAGFAGKNGGFVWEQRGEQSWASKVGTHPRKRLQVLCSSGPEKEPIASRVTLRDRECPKWPWPARLPLPNRRLSSHDV